MTTTRSSTRSRPATKKTEARGAAGEDGQALDVAGPSDAEIARRAHERFLARGAEHGRALEDWLLAEAELRAGHGR
jgi:hypothetical protein